MLKKLKDLGLRNTIKIQDIKDRGNGTYSFCLYDEKLKIKSNELTITQDELKKGKSWTTVSFSEIDFDVIGTGINIFPSAPKFYAVILNAD